MAAKKVAKTVAKTVAKKTSARAAAAHPGAAKQRTAASGARTRASTGKPGSAATKGPATRAAAPRPRAAKVGKPTVAATLSASSGPAVGDRALAFELTDQAGRTVSSTGLSGSPYVLYFYPRDNTPGCTREAQGFQAAARELAALGVRVIGVSPDSTASHAKFADQHGLGFTLLSDPERTLARGYGAYGPKRAMGRETVGIIRSTFLVDASGTLRQVWRAVRVDGHVAAVVAAAREL